MHRTAASIAEVRYGFERNALCVRVGWTPNAELKRASLRFESEGNESSAVLPLDAADHGMPEWIDTEDGDQADAGSYARDALLEVRLPLERWRSRSGETLVWRIVLVRDGAVEESAPGKGWFRTPMPPENPDLLLWSAT